MFVIDVNKNQLVVRDSDQITSGSVNVYTVQFRFSNYWDGFEKTAIFKTRSTSINVRIIDDACTIPWEVMSTPGETIRLGIYGVDRDARILPTVLGNITTVVEGSILGNGESQEPTPSIYEQILGELAKTNDYMDTINNKIETRVSVAVNKYIQQNGLGVTEERVREIVDETVGLAIRTGY